MEVAENGELILSLDEFTDRWLHDDDILVDEGARVVRAQDVTMTLKIAWPFGYTAKLRGLRPGFSIEEFRDEVLRRLIAERD